MHPDLPLIIDLSLDGRMHVRIERRQVHLAWEYPRADRFNIFDSALRIKPQIDAFYHLHLPYQVSLPLPHETEIDARRQIDRDHATWAAEHATDLWSLAWGLDQASTLQSTFCFKCSQDATLFKIMRS